MCMLVCVFVRCNPAHSRWFHTGDVAIWTTDGQLKIVDRLKNLVKLRGGEYVALEAMEATYAQSVFVDGKKGGIMCYADGDMDKPIALVQVRCNSANKCDAQSSS